MGLTEALSEIQAHVAKVVEEMVRSAYEWGSRRSNNSDGNLMDITSGQLAVLCHFHQLTKGFPNTDTLPKVIGGLAHRKGDHIKSWLVEGFVFDDEEIYNFLHKCPVEEIGWFFNEVELNDKYKLLWNVPFKLNVEVADWLIRNGVDVNAKNNKGLTPLHIAASEGDIEPVSYLLSKGADCYAEDNDHELPFDKALQCPYMWGEEFPTADLLLPRVFVSRLLPGSGYTRLHQAAFDGDLLRLKYLLRNIGCPDIWSKDGYTPLHIAVIKDYPEIVKLLIECFACVTVKTGGPNPKTPLELAKEKQNQRIIDILSTVMNE